MKTHKSNNLFRWKTYQVGPQQWGFALTLTSAAEFHDPLVARMRGKQVASELTKFLTTKNIDKGYKYQPSVDNLYDLNDENDIVIDGKVEEEG